MSYYLEDSTGEWLGDFASNKGLMDIRRDKKAPVVLMQFLDAGEANEDLVDELTSQLTGKYRYIAKMLGDCKPPVIITDGVEGFEATTNYNPNQPRDDQGRFGSGGGGGGGSTDFKDFAMDEDRAIRYMGVGPKGQARLKQAYEEYQKDGGDLTESEFSVISGYLGDSYMSVNEPLRHGGWAQTAPGSGELLGVTEFSPKKKKDVAVTSAVRLLDNGIEKLPVYEGDTSRILRIDKNDIAKFMENHKKGSIVSYPAFTSSSAGTLVPKHITEGGLIIGKPNVTMSIKSKTGRDASKVSKATGQYVGEKEVLFARNTQFKVTGIKEVPRPSGTPMWDKTPHYQISMEEVSSIQNYNPNQPRDDQGRFGSGGGGGGGGESISVDEAVTRYLAKHKEIHGGSIERGEQRVRRMAAKLNGDQWKTSEELAKGHFKQRGNPTEERQSAVSQLQRMKNAGSVEVAWDNQGVSYYGLAGANLPKYLSQSDNDADLAKLPNPPTKNTENYNPNQPRDSRGRFGSGGGGGGTVGSVAEDLGELRFKGATKSEISEYTTLTTERTSLNRKVKAGTATPVEVARAKEVKAVLAHKRQVIRDRFADQYGREAEKKITGKNFKNFTIKDGKVVTREGGPEPPKAPKKKTTKKIKPEKPPGTKQGQPGPVDYTNYKKAEEFGYKEQINIKAASEQARNGPGRSKVVSVKRSDNPQGFTYVEEETTLRRTNQIAKVNAELHGNFQGPVMKIMEEGLDTPKDYHTKKPRGSSVELVPGEEFRNGTHNVYGTWNSASNSMEIAAHISNNPPQHPRVGQHSWNVGSDFESVYRHEYGHRAHYALAKNDSQGWNDWQFVCDQNKLQDWHAGKTYTDYNDLHPVSQYSGTNYKECFAESFAAYTSPRYMRGQLPAPIEKFMDKHIGGFEE